MQLDYTKVYTCPDCGAACKGHAMIYHVGKNKTYMVCPHCGVIQDLNEVERQLGKEG